VQARGYKFSHIKDQNSLLNQLIESTMMTPELQQMLTHDAKK
jgi:hypothetical protein